MATKTITSEPFKLNLPGATRPLNFKTETIFESDVNGNPVAGTQKTNLNYQVTPGGIFQTAATSTEGGKAGSWILKNAANSNDPILGEAAIRSLQTPNGVLNQETQKSIITTATKSGISKAYQKPLADKLGNTATTPSAENGTTGPGNKNQETEKDPFDSEKFSKNITSKNARNNFKKTRSGAPDGILVYPDGLRSTKQDVIKFDMLEYKPTKFGSDFGFESRSQNRTSIGTVILPIPSGISDTNSVTWGGPDMNALQAELARAALSTVSGGVSGATDSLQNTAEKIAKNSGEVKTAVAAALAGEAAGVQGLLTRTTGAAINPNLELLFQGPALRPFSFTFKMSARNEKEAKTIISIIRFFKQGMSPQRSTSNLFLKSPHTFKIKYMFRGMNGQEHPFIGKIKECALQSFNVNYTPEGQYATFYDGKMVSYEVQMQFQELEPVFNDDYSELDKNADTQIGY